MIGGRTIHKLRVRNKASKVETVVDVEMNGTYEQAKAHIEKTPPSRGAPEGFSVIGPAVDPNAVKGEGK